MELLTLENGKIDISPYALEIKEFSKIWSGDVSKNKEGARKVLSYIVLMHKYNSPYINYEEKERHKLITEDMGVKINLKEIQGAIDTYRRIQDDSLPSMRYLQASRIAAEKIREFYISFDLNEKTNGGAYALKPKDISSSITDMEKLIRTLDALEEKVKKDMALTDTKIVGGGQAGHYEE